MHVENGIKHVSSLTLKQFVQNAMQESLDGRALTMSTMTNEEYVACSGQVCPFCGDHDIEGGSIDIEGRNAIQEMSCSACEKEWYDVYTLTSFVEY